MDGAEAALLAAEEVLGEAGGIGGRDSGDCFFSGADGPGSRLDEGAMGSWKR